MSMLKFFLLFLVAAVAGCDRHQQTGNSTTQDIPPHVEQLYKEISSLNDLILNYPAEAKRIGETLKKRICDLEIAETREQAVDAMEREILSVDIRHLPKADRERSINVIFDLEMEVLNCLVLTKASPRRQWITRINALRRTRDEMDYAELESHDKTRSEIDRNRSAAFVQFVKPNYEMWLKRFHSDFVSSENGLATSDREEISRMFITFLAYSEVQLLH